FRGKVCQPGDVPARSRKTSDEATSDRITNRYEHNGDRTRCFFGSQNAGCAGSNDDVHLETHQLSRQGGETISLPLRISVLNDNGLPLYVPKLVQTVLKCLGAGRESGRRGTR